jgi:adenylate cyclase
VPPVRAPYRPFPDRRSLDLSDYTRLTQERGDQLAAGAAVELGQLADRTARLRGGRVVKLLGDGVLLAFDCPYDAVMTALKLVVEVEGSGLPAAHAGLHAGPLIKRDGDVYGNTVNVAARVGAQAKAGEVMVTDAVVESMGGASSSIAFESIGMVSLKGISAPVALFLARSPR